MVNGITRRAFLKLASRCGAAVAGLVGLPETKRTDGRLLETVPIDDPFIRLGHDTVTQWIDGFEGWHVVPPPSPRQLHQCETESARYVIFRNDDGSFLYSDDGGFFFHGPMNFWDMPEDVRKAWWMDKVLYGQCNCELYVVRGCCGKPTT